MNGCGCVPIKLFFIKARGRLNPMACTSLLGPALHQQHRIGKYIL
jgi:hypothetical protein